MPAPRVLIRADADEASGTGHLMRSLALAQALGKAGTPAVLAYHHAPPAILAKYRETGASLQDLAATPYSTTDAEATLTLASELACAWVIVDGYHFDESFHQTLAGGPIKVLAIDDFGSPAVIGADLIVNQSASVTPELYQNREGLLLGPSFTLLRKEFSESADRQISNEFFTIVLTTGGGDDLNITPLIIETLAPLLTEKQSLEVVIGPANTHRRELLTRYVDELRANLLCEVSDMAALLGKADLVLSGAGSTVWECLALGTPLLTMVLADNQLDNARYLADSDLAPCAGDAREDGVLAKLGEAVQNVLQNPAQAAARAAKGRTLIDGQGAARIVAQLT